MAAHLAEDSQYRVWMLRLDLKDGNVIGLTSNDQDVPFDLGDAAGGVIYLAGTGCDVGDIEQALGLDVSNYEVTGPVADVITLDALAGGRFSDAEARLFQVNPDRPTYGSLKIQLGEITDVRQDGGEFTFEISSETTKLSQTVGRTISPQCSAQFGDAQCGVVPEEIAATVIDVVDDLIFTVSYPSGSYADNYFNYGKASFTTGELSNTRPIQIFLWNDLGGLTAQVTLLAPLAEAPEVGDAVTIKRGCARIRMSDDPTVPTCKTYNNVNRMRGCPDCIGTDQAMRFPVPGGAGT